jgi:uncharacterized phage protein gp47/JayE
VFENKSYENILEEMLDSISDDIDKREGSIIYTAIAPQAAALSEAYIWLDNIFNLTFADTAIDEYLDRRVGEFGIHRRQAIKAKRKAEFYAENDVPMDIPIGSRFFIDDRYFVAVEKLDDGVFLLECEEAGTIGNAPKGHLLPVDTISGLSKAILTDIIIPGTEEETDDQLRQRFFEAVNEPSFGGNISDYRQKINAMEGVGGTKVFPVWNGGGTVKCVFINADYATPSSSLVDKIQTEMDPEVNQGKGIGLAPIGHVVTVKGVSSVNVSIQTKITLGNEFTIGQVKNDIEAVVNSYLLELRKSWSSQKNLIVRISQIEARILNVPGVIDIADTKVNGQTENLSLNEEEIPILEKVTLV